MSGTSSDSGRSARRAPLLTTVLAATAPTLAAVALAFAVTADPGAKPPAAMAGPADTTTSTGTATATPTVTATATSTDTSTAPATAPATPTPTPTITVTCVTPAVAMYHVDGSAQLRRWAYASPLDGTSGWSEQMIGSAWGDVNVVSGGSGVVYTIDQPGNLRWYLDTNYATGGSESWDPASGTVIGTGWNAFTKVISGGDGVLYAVDSTGALHWYQSVDTDGTFSWAPGSGAVIGTGFDTPTMLVAGGNGVIFAVSPTGSLDWYRHLDPTGGTDTWANGGMPAPIGSGWSDFSQIGSLGAGILMARDGTGTLWWFRDTDPLGGSASWANQGSGTAEGTGWNDNQLVTDVDGCAAS